MQLVELTAILLRKLQHFYSHKRKEGVSAGHLVNSHLGNLLILLYQLALLLLIFHILSLKFLLNDLVSFSDVFLVLLLDRHFSLLLLLHLFFALESAVDCIARGLHGLFELLSSLCVRNLLLNLLRLHLLVLNVAS